MNNPLITVIIPVYNAEEYITQTIESVINQSYTNIEVLIINHCSFDKSNEIINNFCIIDDRLRCITLDNNKGGPAYPRNIGIRESKGEYVAFIDSDDVWMKDKLKTQLSFMVHNNINFSSTFAVHIDEVNNLIYDLNSLKNIVRRKFKYNLSKLVKSNFIYTSSVMISKSILNYFNESTSMISVEDYYLWLTIMSSSDTKFGICKKELIQYRLLSNSLSGRINCGKQAAKKNYALSKFIIEYEKYELYN